MELKFLLVHTYTKRVTIWLTFHIIQNISNGIQFSLLHMHTKIVTIERVNFPFHRLVLCFIDTDLKNVAI
jgi:hypothetical protein